MTEPTEREDLQSLLLAPGWLRFVRAIEEQWGAEACIRKIDVALSSVNRGDQAAVQDTVTQIRSAARAVAAMRDWPKTRVQQLEQMEAQRKQADRPVFSRRGGL